MNTIYPALWQQARALVILKIIFDFGRPVQLRQLVAATGGNHETVAKYCNSLATMGLLTRVASHVGWSLTAQGFAFMRAPATSLSPGLSTGAVDNSNASTLAQIPHNSAESAPLINTTTISTDSVAVEVLSGKSAFFGENLDLFTDIGITLNSQTRFIADHIQPQVIRAEWQKLKDKGKPWPGLLIRILTSSPKPKTQEQRDAEARKRYASYNQTRKP